MSLHSQIADAVDEGVTRSKARDSEAADLTGAMSGGAILLLAVPVLLVCAVAWPFIVAWFTFKAQRWAWRRWSSSGIFGRIFIVLLIVAVAYVQLAFGLMATVMYKELYSMVT